MAGISITGVVAEGEHKGERVWLYWSSESGGWWQWGPYGWRYEFPDQDGERFKDAWRCATAQTWTKKTCGPWYLAPDLASIEAKSRVEPKP